jgi:hypothetical protein
MWFCNKPPLRTFAPNLIENILQNVSMVSTCRSRHSSTFPKPWCSFSCAHCWHSYHAMPLPDKNGVLVRWHWGTASCHESQIRLGWCFAKIDRFSMPRVLHSSCSQYSIYVAAANDSPTVLNVQLKQPKRWPGTCRSIALHRRRTTVQVKGQGWNLEGVSFFPNSPQTQ